MTALAVEQTQVADLMAAYKRLGGLLAEAEAALAVEREARAQAEALMSSCGVPFRQMVDEAITLLEASPDADAVGSDLWIWLRSAKGMRDLADVAPACGPDIAALGRAATDHPLFVHDWADPAVSADPSPKDISLSFVTPDHITAAFMGLGIEGTVAQARADAAFLSALWNGWRAGRLINATDFDALVRLYAEACITIWQQAVEIERQAAIVTDKLGETQLVKAGPARDGFRFDLRDGPIPYIAEYLVQMLGFRDADTPTANYAEIEVHHHEVGAMTLTLQRRSGDTPHQISAKALAATRDAQAKLADARAKLDAGPTDAEIEASAEAAWEECRAQIQADPAQGVEIGPWSAVPPNHAAKGRAETRAALTAFLARRRG